MVRARAVLQIFTLQLTLLYFGLARSGVEPERHRRGVRDHHADCERAGEHVPVCRVPLDAGLFAVASGGVPGYAGGSR